MTQAALHIDDTRISLAVAGEPATACYAEPAFCWISGASLVTGSAARAVQRKHPRQVKDRYVYRLSTKPLSDKRFNRLTAADLLAEQLEQAVAASPVKISSLILIVPGFMDQEMLGVLLGVCQELGLAVTGLVDSSVAAVRAPAEGRAIVQLNLGLHAATVSTLGITEGSVSLVRHDIFDDHGVQALRNEISQRVAETFVKQSRFDPLHDADTEQLLNTSLDHWFEQVDSRTEIELQLVVGGSAHRARMATVDFLGAFDAYYQRIADGIRAAHGAGQPLLVLLGIGTNVPGLAEFIEARTGAETYPLDADAALLGALARASEAEVAGAARLTTTLTLDQPPLELEAFVREASTVAPTHLLDDAQAHPIDRETLTIGIGSQGSARRIAVHGAGAGVSKNHCAIRLEGEQCVVSDHSRYGTFLNGNRISGSAILQPGDTLRVGTPGTEYRLIRVVS